MTENEICSACLEVMMIMVKLIRILEKAIVVLQATSVPILVTRGWRRNSVSAGSKYGAITVGWRVGLMVLDGDDWR